MGTKAFVTGAGGFIASHLVEALLERGWNVTALIHYNSRANWGWLEPHHHRAPLNLKIVLGDITDSFQLREALDSCEVVFHLAALIAIPYSYHAPASYLQTNVVGTLNLAEAARKSGVKRFVHTSTSEVYGTARRTPVDEEHPLQGQSPYSASKIAADKLIESFVCSYGLPAVTVRPFNTYGPRQSARAVIPSIIAQALHGNSIRLGSLDTIRDLTFVSDTVEGFIRAAEADDVTGQVINLGTGEAVSIQELAQTIFKLLGVAPAIVADPKRLRPSASEVQRLVSDNSKAAKLLGWRPVVSLQDGLSRTIEWMRNHAELYRPEEYTL
ncbi:MAG TPA: GDP-mannose 4,6-dehydratase [Candidatus Aquilonibacter sp.]|nr:GDP-mannose 4,6-dehydratase [Candidatus Aquilonibacter sp.]